MNKSVNCFKSYDNTVNKYEQNIKQMHKLILVIFMSEMLSQKQKRILKEEFEKYRSGESNWDGMITFEDRRKQHAFTDFAKDLIKDQRGRYLSCMLYCKH